MSYRPIYEEDEFYCNQLHFSIPNDDGKKVFYTYIRKNACSAFKLLMRQRSNASGPRGEFEFRVDPNTDSWDHSLFIYRDPFDRTVSTYFNKFVDRKGNEDIFSNFSIITSRDPVTASFRDFVNYLTSASFSKLDPHVWPQKSHLADITYTDPVPMGTVHSWFARTLPSLASTFERPINPSSISTAHTLDNLCDIPANQLAGWQSPVGRSSFRVLKHLIMDIYSVYVEMVARIERARAAAIR
ncbi:hypothetical protein CCR83_02690 [Rhodobacter veldkampii DSM 11550]|uniref:Sulfotransferase family protein n=1 Tax=Phaeovulum veldkampii DSM 11550 TaxID=1185920 RepID=A0A2T4J9C2_9RHOB|nr:sulfotransferase family 2 domain-containing protein [Phaeovulum veldkampii]MBK5945381.1 hypothetical protein [Phaeovulum veldkampii DSM 11550]PTE14427.1 hypothetical protein C5F46_14895 [Phaeovulum veldkampii DSM 11550]TDQ54558.1 sulfotransferase family protein [Phaeovulum veldkampii DSM 11550]